LDGYRYGCGRRGSRGVYATDEITLAPDAYDTHLNVDLPAVG
jgi:hypothetical protein